MTSCVAYVKNDLYCQDCVLSMCNLSILPSEVYWNYGVFVLQLHNNTKLFWTQRFITHTRGLSWVMPYINPRPLTTTFFLWRHIPTRAQATLLFRFLGHTQTRTPGRTPLYARSALLRHHLHNTQQAQETNIYTFSEIRTSDPNNPVAAGLTFCYFTLYILSYWTINERNLK